MIAIPIVILVWVGGFFTGSGYTSHEYQKDCKESKPIVIDDKVYRCSMKEIK